LDDIPESKPDRSNDMERGMTTESTDNDAKAKRRRLLICLLGVLVLGLVAAVVGLAVAFASRSNMSEAGIPAVSNDEPSTAPSISPSYGTTSVPSTVTLPSSAPFTDSPNIFEPTNPAISHK
jgi:hypothetical protein